jgi:pimeloyl-ACP methyl ester carboxylesterase
VLGVTLHVRVEGTGLPLVVLPSFRFSEAAMRAVFEPPLAELERAGGEGFGRIYVDLPGTGGSPATEPNSDAVLGQVRAAVDSVIGPDERFALAGWSYGGYLAAGLARRIPHRVSSLLLICTGPRIRPQDRDLSGVRRSTPGPGWLDDVPADLRDHFDVAVGQQTAAVGRRLAAVLQQNGPTDEPFLEELRAAGFALTDEATSTSYDGPATLVAGRRDRIVGYAGTVQLFTEMEHADLVVMAEAGHYLPVEVPDRLAGAVRSWAARTPRA